MFKVTGKLQFGGVYRNGKPIVTFRKGVGYVSSVDDAEYLKDLGYTVEGSAPAADPLAKMKADELKAYAAEKGIDLKGATQKADILAAIRAAEADPGNT